MKILLRALPATHPFVLEARRVAEHAARQLHSCAPEVREAA